MAKSRIIKLAAAAAVALAAVAAAAWAVVLDRQRTPDTANAIAMDTYVGVKVWGADADALIDVVLSIDEALDPFDSESALYKLNRSRETDDRIVYAATEQALAISEPNVDITCGRLLELWDIGSSPDKLPDADSISKALGTVGKENVSAAQGRVRLSGEAYLNFGCCAKGFACDAAAEKLRQTGASCAVVSLGSSTLLYGEKPDGEKFSTAVTDPFDRSLYACVIETDSAFISTSGAYERYAVIDGKSYSHIFDLSSGYPVESDLMSVTVVCGSGIASDIISTSAFAAGTSGIGSYLSRDDIQILAIDCNKNIYASETLIPYIGSLGDGYRISEDRFR